MKIDIVKLDPESYKKDQNKFAQMRAFDCKNRKINRCFKCLLADDLHSYTYLFYDTGNQKIISFVSFCASAIQVAKNKRIITLPAVELKLFGVDKNYQGTKVIIDGEKTKYSEYTFQWLIAYIREMVQPFLSVEYLVLHAIKDEVTLAFYQKMGLEYISPEQVLQDYTSLGCSPMFLKL